MGWVWSPAVATMWRWGWRWARGWVAASASARVSTGWLVRAESSCQLGVIQVTRGSRSRWRVSIASGGSRSAPELARRMGSRTMGRVSGFGGLVPCWLVPFLGAEGG